MISVVILATGQTDDEKLFLRLNDKPALQWMLESALGSDADEVICVTGDLAAARREIKLVNERLFWHLNASAARGQSTSVIAGLWASHPQSEGVMFIAGDKPPVRKELINSLIEKFHQSRASIVAASFSGEARGPLLFRRDFFPELLKLTGDNGGLSLLAKSREKTALVEWQEEVSFLHLDGRPHPEGLKERV
jgi:molybdenum cofactor cytidylyltransferase